MSIKLIASVAATTVALASTCAFAQSNDLSSRVSALESQINSMSGGVVTLNSALSYDLLNGASSIDQSANVKNAKMDANTLSLGGYVALGYQKATYKDGTTDTDTSKDLGFDAALMSMVARVGNDVTLVVTSAANVNSNPLSAKAPEENTRTISDQQFKVSQAYGVWKMNDQFYAFAGKKDLAFGDFSSVNYVSGDIDSVRRGVNGFGVGSDTLVDGLTMVATVYNTKDNAFDYQEWKGTGMSNWAFNTSYSGLTDGLTVGAGVMNHAAERTDGTKIGAMTVNFNYALPDTNFTFSGNYSQEDKKLYCNSK